MNAVIQAIVDIPLIRSILSTCCDKSACNGDLGYNVLFLLRELVDSIRSELRDKTNTLGCQVRFIRAFIDYEISVSDCKDRNMLRDCTCDYDSRSSDGRWDRATKLVVCPCAKCPCANCRTLQNFKFYENEVRIHSS